MDLTMKARIRKGLALLISTAMILGLVAAMGPTSFAAEKGKTFPIGAAGSGYYKIDYEFTNQVVGTEDSPPDMVVFQQSKDGLFIWFRAGLTETERNSLMAGLKTTGTGGITKPYSYTVFFGQDIEGSGQDSFDGHEFGGPYKGTYSVVLENGVYYARVTSTDFISHGYWYQNPNPVITEPEDTKPEDTKPEDTKPEDTKPEDTKPEDTKPEDTKPEDTKPEDTKPEDTKPEDTKPEDTKPQTPIVETPVVETPVVETPVVETPVVETPIVETPVVETPVVETPVFEIPEVEIPLIQASEPSIPATEPEEEILTAVIGEDEIPLAQMEFEEEEAVVEEELYEEIIFEEEIPLGDLPYTGATQSLLPYFLVGTTGSLVLLKARKAKEEEEEN